MDYQNPTPDDSVNVSNEHPLKEFFQLTAVVLVVTLIAVVTLGFFAGALAKRIPFEYEQSLLGGVELFERTDGEKQQWLEQQTREVVSVIDLPEDMSIKANYSDGETVNAFATLGGQVVLFQGLIDKFDSDDEVIAVLAHEVAHVKHRHPIVAAGKGLTIAVFLGSISGASGSSAGDWLIGSTANLTMLQFSRDQELEADKLAAKVLVQRFGHIQGLQKLFERFDELEQGSISSNVPQLLRSHPYSNERWERVKAYALEQSWPVEGELTPLSFPQNN